MRNIITILLLLVANCITAQSNQQFANIGDFTTVDGNIIKDCKVGYRTVGKINTEKTNAVLWPTWFTGTSEQVFGMLNNIIDTTGLYVIIVDALTNGVSSSPSNMYEFPKITIRDMVNSQYKLLTDHLNISHLYAVMGISMGGMQTFEWLVAYPDFMDKAIPIVGNPNPSSYDILIFQTMADIITKAGQEEEDLNFAFKRAHNILLMNLHTPAYIAYNYKADSLDVYINQFAATMKPEDYLGGLNAIISHDIYKSANSNPDNITNIIEADLLVIVASQDHLVNPILATTLAEKLRAQLVTLSGNCGHMAVFCETDKVKKTIAGFLN